ncbi:internalin N-terminal domain-containing protein [Listeria monocytogenes]|nr:internalin N-terminal domain-containing protein [Listeria monocytogenes]EKZ1062787.1 internalin N-terminal domain-containing protein [Listeria monocytogenes]EKZ1068649.1 internalin N-terminal domain-containing protein [Listeria monocytogenes]
MKNLFRLFLVFSIVIIGVVSFQAIDASANETDVYPLPARIIDVFPDENLAEDMVENFGKKDVTDVITQDDVDAVTSLGLGYFTNYLTDEDLQMLENAYFTNVNNIMIYPTQTMFTGFPDLPTLPKLDTLRAEGNLSSEVLPENITVPDYQNYPELKYLDLSNRTIVGGLPNFSNIPKLETLLMSSCGLASEDVPDFTNLKNLQKVNFQTNQFRTEMTDFTHLDSLVSMDLSYNYLNILPPTIVDKVIVLGQIGTLPDQNVAFGVDTNITLPVYTQLDDLGRISGFQEVWIRDSNEKEIYNVAKVDYDEVTKQIIVPTHNLDKGEYTIEIDFNGIEPYVEEGEVMNYSVKITIN